MRWISLRKRKISFTEGVRQLGRRRIRNKSARWMTKRIVVLQMLPLYALVFVCAYVRARSVLWTCENAYFCHFLAKLTMLVFITLLENCENYVRKNENGSNACAWKGIAGNGVGAWVRRLSRRCQKRGKREWKQKKWTNCTLFLQKERLYLNFASGFRE